MAFLKMVIGIVAFIVALKVLGFLLAIVGLVLKLAWLAVIIGFFVLIGFIIYKLLSPRSPQQV